MLKKSNLQNQNDIDDPDFSKQWSLKNTGRNSGGFFSWGKIGEDVDAIDAWNLELGSKDIKKSLSLIQG